MAFQKEKSRVLTGSLNLLPSGDQVPNQDAIELQNWRIDAPGVLRSTRGMNLQPTVIDGTIHTLYRNPGTTRYVGAGDRLYRDAEVLVTDGFDGVHLSLVYYREWVWVMNRAKQIKDDGGLVYNWSIAAPETAPTATAGAAGSLNGDYQFYVTFDNNWGHESGPSPASNTVTLTDQTADISDIPVSTDPQVTRRHIYGIGGQLQQIYWFGTIFDNTTTEFEIEFNDLQVQAFNRVLNPLRGGPPPARGVVGPYLGRLIAYSSAAHPARIWWTEVAEPWAWVGADDENAGNWIDIGEEAEEILAVTFNKRLLIIYKERSIWRIPGDVEQSEPEKTNVNVSASGLLAVVNAGARDYFASDDGVYRFNGEYEEKVTWPIDPLFKNDFYEVSDDVFLSPVSVLNKHLIAMEYANGLLWMSYPEDQAELNTSTLIFDTVAQRWVHRRLPEAFAQRGFSVLFYEGQTRDLLGAQSNQVYALEQEKTDGGEPIELRYQSRYMDQGLPDQDKVYSDLVIDYRTALAGEIPPEEEQDPDDPIEPATLQVKMLFGNGEHEEFLGELHSATRIKEVFRIVDGAGWEDVNAAVRIEGPTRTSVVIYSIYLHWYTRPRDGKAFDSSEIDLGTEKVKSLSEVELTIANLDVVSVEVMSELPGRQMDVRQQFVVEAGPQRPVRLPVTELCEGRLLRLLVRSTQPFKLWSARLRVLAYGLYVEQYEGQTGFVWTSLPLNFGTSDIKQARALYFEIDSEGAVEYDVLTDLPEGFLDVVATGSLIDTPGRAQVRIEFPLPLPAGQLWEVRLLGDSAYRLFKGHLELRQFAERRAAAEFWSSMPTDLGTPHAKEFESIEIELYVPALEPAGPLMVTVLTDLPGGQDTMPMTARYTSQPHNVVHGQQKIIVDLPDDVEGRLIELRLTGQEFYLVKAIARCQVIGLYLTGVEVWYSDEYDFGTERVKIVRELEVEANIYEASTFQVWTDLPGGDMALRLSTAILEGQGGFVGRRTYKFPMPGDIKGRLWQIQMGGSWHAKIYTVRALVKTLGENAPTGWHWMEWPINPSTRTLQELVFPGGGMSDWIEAPLPIPPTPNEFTWVDLPMDE